MDENKRTIFERSVPWLYLVFFFFLLQPLTTGIGRLLPGPRVDTFQNLWNFWWVRRAFLDLGTGPFFTPDLLWPGGADLSYHTLSLGNTLLAVPLGGILSPAALLGLCLTLAYPIGAWGAYLLSRELGAGRAGAFLGGLFFALFPHHLDQIHSHLNLTSNQFLPFFLLYLVRTLRRPSLRAALLSGLFLAIQAWFCLTYMMQGLLLAAAAATAALLFPPGGRRERRWIPRLAAGLALFLLLIAPLVVPPLRSSEARGEFTYKNVRPNLSASLETLASPGVFHPVLGKTVHSRNRRYDHLPRGSTTYLGLAALVLAGAGIRRRRSSLLLAGGAFLFLLLSLGPDLMVRIGVTTGIPLPYRIVQSLPILRFLRVPNRFLIPYSLLAAPLVAAGFTRLWADRRARAAAAMLAALLLFEYFPAPLSTAPIGRPDYRALLAARRGAGAVLDVPLFLGSMDTMYMYDQTVHGRPIAAGYVSIPPPNLRWIAGEHPFFAWVADPFGKEEADEPEGIDPTAALRRLGFGDVVLHKDFDGGMDRYAPPGMDWPEKSDAGQWYWKHTTVTGSVSSRRMKRYRSALERWLGPPWHEDDRVALFAVPEETGGTAR
ncbi:MAG: hypothetical protein JW958_10085 [Candidatus Eisenbacteria bacterium]|nr:hypothetical protein [Candidatus Eisenbacteria bacterium]